MKIATLLLTLATAAAAAAQDMPDPRLMSGLPLPAAELPDATVSVRIFREQIGNSVAGVEVRLTGGGVEQTATTDAEGRAQFAGLTPGTAVLAAATLDGETLTSQELTVPGQGGVRVALVFGLDAAEAREREAAAAAAAAPARPGVVVLGGNTRIIVEFQDDNLTLFYLLEFVNQARTPIDTGGPLIIDLPQGAAGASAMQGSSPRATVRGDRVTVTGPFPPGVTAVQVGFTLPTRSATMTIEQRFPAVFEQVFVAMERVGEATFDSPQVSATQEASASGQPFVLGTGGRLNTGDPLILELTGLPHKSTRARDVALGLVALIFAAGAWAAYRGAPASRVRDSKLAARREALFAELATLDDAVARAGQASDAQRARRQALVAELERVLGELDRSTGDEGVAA